MQRQIAVAKFSRNHIEGFGLYHFMLHTCEKLTDYPPFPGPTKHYDGLLATNPVLQGRIFVTIHISGLRLSEAAHLRVRDIDNKGMRLFVHQGKVAKIATPFSHRAIWGCCGNIGTPTVRATQKATFSTPRRAGRTASLSEPSRTPLATDVPGIIWKGCLNCLA